METVAIGVGLATTSRLTTGRGFGTATLGGFVSPPHLAKVNTHAPMISQPLTFRPVASSLVT